MAIVWIWRILRIVLVVYAVACLLLWIFQARMLYFPEPAIESTPEDFGIKPERVSIPGANGSTLDGWWISSSRPSAPTLIYFHGNYGNIGANAEHGARLARACCNVLLFDYRGYGRSSGPFPNERRMYEDADASWNYVVGEKKAAANHVFLYGHSLGGAVAIEMATRHPDAAGLIIENTFTSVVNRASQEPLYHWFPTRWLVHERFDSIKKIASVRIPLLVISGTADTIIPRAMSKELYDRAPGPKQLLLVEGAGHDDAAIIGGSRYVSAVQEFTTQAVPQQQLSNR
jgi:pimeloyl-ACP methyl ester carboxylesterase